MADKMSMDVLLKLMSEYNTDFASLQGELPSIQRKSDGVYSKYAKFEAIRDATTPIISKHGFSIMQDFIGSSDDLYMQTIVKHKNGYFEEFKCPVIYDEKIKDSQKVGGLKTYYKRYTYVTILGISTPDEDLDDIPSSSKNDTSTATFVDDMCPLCNGQLQQRDGKFGPFIGCSNYKTTGCKFIKK